MKSFFIKIFLISYRLIYYPLYQSFIKSLKDPDKTQQRLKKELFKKYKRSQLAQKNPHFKCFEDLPLTTYEDYIPYIEQGLTPEKVLVYEQTSGSSGKNKRIPYPRSLLNSFKKMFLLWSYDICRHLSFNSLVFYFSISPQFQESDGFESDKEYLGPFLSKILSLFFVEAKGIKKLKTSHDFHCLLFKTLVHKRDLEIISIWSPTFLLSLLDYAKDNWEELKDELQVPSIDINRLETLFPQLKLISTWGDGHAKYGYQKLQQLFPSVTIQKKGLLATEAPLSIPIIESKGHIPLISECYFEFLDDSGKLHKIGELEIGKVYELVISQKGGLIRYQIKDLIKITHYYYQTPCLEFIGRQGSLCDLVGEKLHLNQVEKALRDTQVLYLLPDHVTSRYFLLSDHQECPSQLEKIEVALRQNIHYHNARELTQLHQLEWLKIENLQEKIINFYEDQGIKRGDQKVNCFLYREYNGQLKSYLFEKRSK